MKKRILMVGIVVACLLVSMAGVGQTAFIGFVYDGDSDGAYNPASGPSFAPTWSFTVDKLDFSAYGPETYAEFLSGGAGNPNNFLGLNGWTGAEFITTAGGFKGTLFEFAGTGYFPTNVAILHDDGFFLRLGNVSYDLSTPVSPTLSTLNNAAGTYDFTMYYGATNSYPEVLQARGVMPVPEPGTMMLLGSGLVGLAGFGRRKFKI